MDGESYGSSALSVRLGVVALYALALLVGLGLYVGADTFGPDAYAWAAAALELTGLSNAAQAGVLYGGFALVPIAIFAGLYYLARNSASLFRLLCVALALAVLQLIPSRGEMGATPSDTVADAVTRLSDLTFIAVGVASGAWLVLRLARWFVSDERHARESHRA